jgi:tetratricopeptide (TPR) repeat protein
MKSSQLAAVLMAASALVSSAYGADDQAKSMPGMAMPPMTFPPMPAIYPQADKPGAPIFKLGDHHHKISASNDQTQMYFDQGVKLLFGFNHAEAIRSFREAARLDPNCAMCWWGVAFALGPNINLPMPPDAVAPAWAALQKAKALEASASPEERDWIEALAARYSDDPKADRAKLDEAFAQSMAKLWHDHSDDLDAGTFYAEAMMDTQPWNYWEADGKTPHSHGAEIVSTLEEIIKREPNHPGALHLYIHAVEASTTPERAEAAADRLEPMMPDAGHIVHMPSHIYFRVGRYKDAAHVNELAAEADESYVAACKATGFYPLGYYTHNLHFLWTSSEMLGQYKASETAAQRVLKNALTGGPMVSLPPVQLYQIVPIVTDIRFGKWDEALAEPQPADNLKLVKAMSLYARGFAYANKRDFTHAAEERAALAKMIDDKELADIDAFGTPGTQMAQLGVALVDGEIARKQGHTAAELAAFKTANDLYNALPYTEPDYWHEPVSHIYGAALLAAHKPAAAEAVYRDSLNVHRIDGWALYGLAQALKAQHKTKEAAEARKEFATAWQLADVKLTSSRF